MITTESFIETPLDTLVAELTSAAHKIALQYEFFHSFADAELTMWEALHDVAYRQSAAVRQAPAWRPENAGADEQTSLSDSAA